MGLPSRILHKGNSMKYAAIAAILFSAPVWAEEVDEATSQAVVQKGEVIGSRPYVQPTLGFDLLIRHSGRLYVCQVTSDTQFGYNGAPNVDFVAVERCVSQTPD